MIHGVAGLLNLGPADIAKIRRRTPRCGRDCVFLTADGGQAEFTEKHQEDCEQGGGGGWEGQV